jgi:hypothetical protein
LSGCSSFRISLTTLTNSHQRQALMALLSGIYVKVTDRFVEEAERAKLPLVEEGGQREEANTQNSQNQNTRRGPMPVYRRAVLAWVRVVRKDLEDGLRHLDDLEDTLFRSDGKKPESQHETSRKRRIRQKTWTT